jgi:hypothetical protein
MMMDGDFFSSLRFARIGVGLIRAVGYLGFGSGVFDRVYDVQYAYE